MEYTQAMKNRLRRMEGQIRGIIKMMEEGKSCKEVVSQMSAVRNALDRAIGVVVSSNLEACIREEIAKGQDTSKTIKEAVDLLVRSR
ncbi:MAG: cytoplasmic protein [Bacillaceae bacterium G1]|jgi:Uncharacterized protein conserved in bacteria|nr:cytoplasmic protein [Bacillota bacterium]OJF16725.1 MAG: cytoplasmic protein [Bacillaceae bacterium G1]